MLDRTLSFGNGTRRHYGTDRLRGAVAAAGLAGVSLVAFVDIATGSEISLSIFYLLPIAVVALSVGRGAGLILSVISASLWLYSDLKTGSTYSNAFIPYWNATVRLGFFVLTTLLLDHIRFLTRNLETVVAERTADLVGEVEQRKVAEDRAKEREDRLLELAENIQEVFWVSSPDKEEMLYVSPAYQNIWGRSVQSLYRAPRSWLEAVHPDDYGRVLHASLHNQRSGFYEEEYRILRPDGSLRWIHDRAFPVFDASGNLVRVVGTADDITLRKRGESRTAIFAGLGHQLAAAAHPGEAAEIIMNTASELFGWDAGYLHLYLPGEDLIMPVLTVDTVGGKRTRLMTTAFTLDPTPLMRKVMDGEAQLINRPDGIPGDTPLVAFGDSGRASASMMYVPIRSERTSLAGVFSIQSYTPHAYCAEDLALLQSLAEHCANALARIRAAAASRDLALIVENSEDAIISRTLQGVITSWNKGAEKLYGYTADEALGQPASIIVPPSRLDEYSSTMSRLQRGEKIGILETVRKRKDGQLVEVSLTFSPVCDETGALTGTSIIARDITERRTLQREVAQISIQEQQRIAHELHDHFGAYLAGLAFRTKSLAESLQARDIPEQEEAGDLVGLVNNAVGQVRCLSHMLAMDGGSCGNFEQGLCRLAKELEMLFLISCPVTVMGNFSTGPRLGSDRWRQLYRIAQEAARNAIQHGKAKTVEFSLRQIEENLELVICNDGRPWQPRSVSETGLGLKIMHYRATSIGGTLDIGPDAKGRPSIICRIPLEEPQAFASPAPGTPTS